MNSIFNSTFTEPPPQHGHLERVVGPQRPVAEEGREVVLAELLDGGPLLRVPPEERHLPESGDLEEVPVQKHNKIEKYILE